MSSERSFDEFYEAMFHERWHVLKTSLTAEPKYFSLSDGLTKPYFLDEASVLAAQALDVRPGDKVLDLCAAPGGKTLVLALALKKEGSLIANERSSARRARLLSVLDEHLPKDIRLLVHVTGHDAAKWGLYEKNTYDRVLLDVPCSSEAHILKNPKYLASWTPARTKHLAVQAFAMLASAFDSLKPGGFLVYATCALSKLENDGVVAKLLDRRRESAPSEDFGLPWEKTEVGFQIWPDRFHGMGPIYFSKIKKNA